jgi:integrase
MGVRDPVNVENIWRQNRGRLGFEDVTTHALWKTAATGLDVAGMSARGIDEYLGHAKPSLTQDVYMSRNVGSAAAAEHLERMFGISSELSSDPIS